MRFYHTHPRTFDDSLKYDNIRNYFSDCGDLGSGTVFTKVSQKPAVFVIRVDAFLCALAKAGAL